VRLDVGRLAWIVAAAALMLAGATGWRTLSAARRDLHPARRRLSEGDRADGLRSLPGLEQVELRTDDGLLLGGWFAAGRDGSAVVLVHGLGANRAELLPEAALLVRRGHAVLLFDSRNCGESEGEIATWGDTERRDVVAALRWIRAHPGVDPSRVGLYGFSVGASTVAMVAAVDPAVRAVAVGSVWPSLRAELGHRFSLEDGRSAALAALIFRLSGVEVDAVRPVDAFGAISPRPLLFLSGTLDDDTPSRMEDALAKRVPGATRWRIQGAGHGGFSRVSPKELDVALGGFFDGALSAPVLPPRH
jgi:pimeloyl-ACP methyl ester carboxylesterase